MDLNCSHFSPDSYDWILFIYSPHGFCIFIWKKRKTTDYLDSCTTNRVPSQCSSHLLPFSTCHGLLFFLFTLWSKCRQLHSRTAFMTVSWFYVALTPRRQRKQKMKKMKPTMAITFHMHALHVVATSLNQKYDTHSYQTNVYTYSLQLRDICLLLLFLLLLLLDGYTIPWVKSPSTT
jgi:hypothetical protein